MLKAKRVGAGIYRVYDDSQWVALLVEQSRDRWFIEAVTLTRRKPTGFGFIRQTKHSAMQAFSDFWFGTEG